MNGLDVGVLAAAVAVGVAAWRLSPLGSARRAAVILLRVAAVGCVWLALKGASLSQPHARLREVVYVVDQSASIDAGKTRWEAARLASLEARRPGKQPRSVIVFGRQARVMPSMSPDLLANPEALARALSSSAVDRGATDLEAALLSSLTQSAPASPEEPTARSRNAILITDGRQTSGRVERVLSHLRRFGMRVYPVAVPPSRSGGVAWERLWVPPTVKQGAAVPVKLLLSNGTGQPQLAQVLIRMQGLPVARARYRLPDAWHVVSMSVPTLSSGTMTMEIEARLGDETKPQRRVAHVEVEGPAQALVVTDQAARLPPLAQALRQREIGVAVARPGELPVEAGRLLDYDAVVLDGIPKSSLTQPQADALRQYVERFGGGVVMVGLGGRLDQEIAMDAPLDQLLPVRFEPKGLQEAKRRLCMVLLIDRSASMLGPRIAATKRAAVELVKQLEPEDLVGVLAFDTAPYVVLEIQPAAQASSAIVEKLVRLKSTGGTDLLPALRAAQSRLLMTDAKVKHMILLSDGNTPFDAQVYRKLLTELVGQGVSICTIGIGSAFINTEILDLVARATGGTFYQLNSLEELPRLIARDTEQAMSRLPFSEGYFRPTPTAGSSWFPEIAQWPPVKGYLTATAKPGAAVELEIPRQPAPGSGQEHADPLLASWSIGLGQVASFTSDADARWSPEWVRWGDFERVWAQVLRQVMRQRAEEELFVWLDERPGGQALILEGQLSQPDAQVISQDGRLTAPLALVQESRVRWSGQVGSLEPGWYRLVVGSKPDDNGPTSAALIKRWVQIGRAEGTPPEDPSLPPDLALLAHISHATQGADEAPDLALLPVEEWSTESRSLRPWLLPLAILLLLADVALRGRTLL
jgi:Mg-chelatase subunit ChlD